jgi:hypothetical protein
MKVVGPIIAIAAISWGGGTALAAPTITPAMQPSAQPVGRVLPPIITAEDRKSPATPVEEEKTQRRWRTRLRPSAVPP